MAAPVDLIIYNATPSLIFGSIFHQKQTPAGTNVRVFFFFFTTAVNSQLKLSWFLNFSSPCALVPLLGFCVVSFCSFWRACFREFCALWVNYDCDKFHKESEWCSFFPEIEFLCVTAFLIYGSLFKWHQCKMHLKALHFLEHFPCVFIV